MRRREFIAALGGAAAWRRAHAAQANGVQFGRKPKLNAYQRREALERRKAGEAMVAIARSYGVSHQTIGRL